MMVQIFVFILFLLTSPAWAVDHYIAASGGGGTTCSAGSPCTMTYVNGHVSAGDTVKLQNGDYSGTPINPTNSGTSGNYITYEAVNPCASGSCSVIIRSQTYGADLRTGQDYIKISGIQFGKSGNSNKLTYWIDLDNGNSNIYVYNCRFINASAYDGIYSASGTNTEYMVIDSCEFPDESTDPATECGQTSGTYGYQGCPSDFVGWFHCTKCLFINNDLGECTHSALNLGYNTQWTVVKNNTFHNGWHHNIAIGAAGRVIEGLLVDGNTVSGAGDTRDERPWTDPKVPSTLGSELLSSIVRRNLIYATSQEAYGIQVGIGQTPGTEPHDANYNHIYNNTVYGTLYGLTLHYSNTDVKNNVFKNNSVSNSPTYNFEATIKAGAGDIEANKITYNNFYSPNYHKYVTPSGGVITGSTDSMEANANVGEGATPPQWIDNTHINPGYVSPGSDFTLSATSGLIDTGTHLTTTNGSGTNSTALVVNDSYYFYSKETWATPTHANVASDYIYINGATPSEIVQITAVNRSTHTLTLASNRTWANGVAVGVAVSSTAKYYGSAPDIGYSEYGAGAGSLHIELSKSSLSPTCAAGANAAQDTFTVRNAGAGTLSYTVSDDQTWLSETPASGDSTGESDTITVSYSTSALAAGSYSATITVAATGAENTPQTIPVSLTVYTVSPTVVQFGLTLGEGSLTGMIGSGSSTLTVQ